MSLFCNGSILLSFPDLLRLASDYTHVAAFHGNIARPQMKETEDQASILLRMTNGATATCRLDYLRPETAPPHGDARLRVVGSEGILECVESQPELSLLSASEPPKTIRPAASGEMLHEFLRFIDSGQAPRLTGEDCFYATEVVLRAREAADSKTLVALPGREKSSK